MKGTVVLLDEASMVGNADKEKLVQLANILEARRFAAIGDRKQLGAVDAGKPFDVLQRSAQRRRSWTSIFAREATICARPRKQLRAGKSTPRFGIWGAVSLAQGTTRRSRQRPPGCH